jgi:hypothetical protein
MAASPFAAFNLVNHVAKYDGNRALAVVSEPGGGIEDTVVVGIEPIDPSEQTVPATVIHFFTRETMS